MEKDQLANLRFLVVEDEAFQREALAMLLTNLGARHVVEAENGQIALAKLEEGAEPIDIVLCDLEMPEMDGMAFLRRLSQTVSHVSVIIVSSQGQAMLDSVVTMAKAYKVEVLGAIAKPCSRSQLLALIAHRKVASSGPQTPRQESIAISERELATALKRGEFVPFFQPKVDLSSGLVVGMEALVRWLHPKRGVVAPALFLGAIESYGLMDTMTWIVLAKSTEICRGWNGRGLSLTVSVNLSLSSLSRLGLAERIHEVVVQHGLEPSRMVLEVTETAAMSDIGPCLENLTRLRMRGFGLSIDDFGTGYSSVQQLTRVPFTELKIDQSFVKTAVEQISTRIVVESSQDVARKLGLKVTAEGVETIEHWQMLQQMGCDIAQGYFIAKPMPAEEIENWLKNWRPPSDYSSLGMAETADILLVEDEDLQREIYGELLEQLGLGRVDTACDVDDALRYLGQADYDLVITDIELGDRSGLDLIRLIRAHQTPLSPATRLILLSSHDDQNVVIQSIALDINGFLNKPANARTLLDTIRKSSAEKFIPQPPHHYLEKDRPDPNISHMPETTPPGETAADDQQTWPAAERIHLANLHDGMVLVEPVFSMDKGLILSPGHQLTHSIINRLKDISGHLESPYFWVRSPPS